MGQAEGDISPCKDNSQRAELSANDAPLILKSSVLLFPLWHKCMLGKNRSVDIIRVWGSIPTEALMVSGGLDNRVQQMAQSKHGFRRCLCHSVRS